VYQLLELFCGTKSISKAFEQNGFKSTTLDNVKSFHPDICMNIFKWDYKELDPKFDVIWASPPCQGFSVCKIGMNWTKANQPKTFKARQSVGMVERTLEIIDYFKPKYWFIENPVGKLRVLPVVSGLPRATISYCQYGDTRMKPTDIWGTFPKGFPIRKCKQGDKCHVSAPRGSHDGGTQGLKDATERGRIPHDFCNLLAMKIKEELDGKSNWWW